MAQKQRKDFYLKDTAKLYDAVKQNSTYVKDYSLTHLFKVSWRLSDAFIRKRFVKLDIGDTTGIFNALEINEAVHYFVEHEDINGWIPRDAEARLRGEKGWLTIDTNGLNWECLRDHVARLTIGDKTVIVDLEELLKATRYA